MSHRVKAEWLSDGRSMQLLEPVIYRDAAGRPWVAPAGTVVDGASIPQFFWRVIGSPFVGKYRRASVLHDYYCQTQTTSSAETHHMFRAAMLRDGVEPWRARLMFWAVRLFGPRF